MIHQLIAQFHAWRIPWLFFVFMLMMSSMGSSYPPMSSTTTQPNLGTPAVCDASRMTDSEIAASRGISLEALYFLHTRRGPSNADICALPADKLAEALSIVPGPESGHPDEALKFRRLQLQDENGFIPPDGLIKAAEQVKRMRAARGPNAPSGAGISPSGWTWLGPEKIGGRIRSIVINPTTPSTMFVGSVSGGIWKTANGGASWQPVDDFMANLSVSTMIIDPTNSNILYAGTGEEVKNIYDFIRGAGIFKSTDGGTTWSQLPFTNNSNFYFVNRLAISPNGSILLAATGTGIWRSTDGGSSWVIVLNGADNGVSFEPNDSSKAIASSMTGHAWYTVDGGINWMLATGFPLYTGRIELAYAPGVSAVVYAGVERNGGEVWLSTDDGHSYSLVNTGSNYSASYWNNSIWVDPTNACRIVVGGTHLWRTPGQPGSPYCDFTLTNISEGQVHADHHVIVNHPGFNGSSNRTVYFGNDGGIYKTDDVSSTIVGWQNLNNNLGITQFYGAAGNATKGWIVGGTQDNGTLRYTGETDNWHEMFGGDGGFAAADPTDPNYFYGEYIRAQVHRSTDGGAAAFYIYGLYNNGSTWTCKPPPYQIPDACNNAANFIAPFILDPNNPNRLLVGGLSLWRSNDVKSPDYGTSTSGPQWLEIKPPSLNQGTPIPISAIAVAPGNSDIVWVGHDDGEVYKTTNGTSSAPTWTRMDLNTPNLPQRYVTRLTIDRSNSNIVYATYGGFTSNNVWRTTDSGNTWSPITGSGSTQLPQVPVRSLVISPFNSNWLYVGTEIGVFDSEDDGAHWIAPQDGPANVSVDELFWMNNTLVAATHGRGLFRVDTSCYTLMTNVIPSGSGTMSLNPPPNCNNGTKYAFGTTVTLTATANTNYAFTGWSGDASGTANPTTVTMNANKNITANFGQPDLRPYAPSGYQYPVVPSSITGTHQVNTLYAGQPTYFDFHFINSGSAIASGNFNVELWVDSMYIYPLTFSNWGAGWTGGFDDWPITISTPGWHTVILITDPYNTIAESDETNNVWQMQFYWESPKPFGIYLPVIIK